MTKEDLRSLSLLTAITVGAYFLYTLLSTIISTVMSSLSIPLVTFMLAWQGLKLDPKKALFLTIPTNGVIILFNIINLFVSGISLASVLSLPIIALNIAIFASLVFALNKILNEKEVAYLEILNFAQAPGISTNEIINKIINIIFSKPLLSLCNLLISPLINKQKASALYVAVKSGDEDLVNSILAIRSNKFTLFADEPFKYQYETTTKTVDGESVTIPRKLNIASRSMHACILMLNQELTPVSATTVEIATASSALSSTDCIPTTNYTKYLPILNSLLENGECIGYINETNHEAYLKLFNIHNDLILKLNTSVNGQKSRIVVSERLNIILSKITQSRAYLGLRDFVTQYTQPLTGWVATQLEFANLFRLAGTASSYLKSTPEESTSELPCDARTAKPLNIRFSEVPTVHRFTVPEVPKTIGSTQSADAASAKDEKSKPGIEIPVL